MSRSLWHPFDLRNFLYYARRRKITFEIADPAKKYDIVVLSPRADLSIWNNYPKKNGKVIFFIVDSYLAIPPSDIKGALRGLAKYLGREHKYLKINYAGALKEMCSRADAIVCTTLEQKNDIEEYCTNVRVILEFHFNIVREIKTDYTVGKRINLVWEGQAENIYGFMQIKDVLTELRKKHPIALHLITDLERKKYMNIYKRVSILDEVKRIFCDGFFTNTAGGNDSLAYLYQWNLGMLSRIIPLDTRTPLMCGKPENKLVLFWRMGMPAIVSATPAYARAMDKAGLPFCCNSDKEWFDKLEKLITDTEARKFAGLQGKKTADTVYGEEEYLKQWDQLFQSVL